MERRELWKTSVPLEHLEGVYVHGNRLWVHDGQWRSALLDLGTGDCVRSLELYPPQDVLRSVLRPTKIEQRLRVEPILIQDKLLLSITSASLEDQTDEFGLVLASHWDSETPRYEPIRFVPRKGEEPYARGIHQGTYLTEDGHLAFIAVQSLYDETTQDSGPYRFGFFVLNEAELVFEMISQSTYEGENMGGAHRHLSIPAGWRALKLEQPVCFDWSPAASVWTFRTLTIEASKDQQDFRLQALIPVNVR